MVKLCSIVDKAAEVKTCLANGQGYINDLKYPVALAVALKVWFPEMEFHWLLIVGVIFTIGMAILGYIDLNYIRLHQRTQEIQTEKYNPYFRNLKKSLNRRKK